MVLADRSVFVPRVDPPDPTAHPDSSVTTQRTPSPEDPLELSEEHAQIRNALNHLSDKDRQLVWLRDVEELSYEDIGGRLGSAVGTVRVAYHRARKKLQEAYDGLEQDV